jgi:hypothetical protein
VGSLPQDAYNPWYHNGNKPQQDDSSRLESEIIHGGLVACMERDARGRGSLRKIQKICSYNIEMWKAAGMYLDGVDFVRLSDVVSCQADQYWALTMEISRKIKLSEINGLLSSKDKRLYGSLDPSVWTVISSGEVIRTPSI